MSTEIDGFQTRDSRIVALATLSAAAISVETGIPHGVAYSNRGAEYAVKIALTAFRRLGLIEGDIDEVKFDKAVRDIEISTLPSTPKTTLALQTEGE